MRTRLPLLLLLLPLTACTAPPRPAILEEVDRTRTAAAQKESAALAPQAFLAAEKIRADASRACDDGDRAGCQILGEQAVAAYVHAQVLARLAKADERERLSAEAVRSAEAQQTALDAEQQRVAAEANDAELRYRVARDALPVAESEPASADRERARLAAARAIAVEARLLCVARQMLSPDTDAVTEAFKALSDLDAEIAKTPVRAPIDAAVKLRSTCLAELSKIRRAKTSAAPEAGATDALLEALSRASFEPRRDDRGISVSLFDAFASTAGTAPSKSVGPRLEALAQAAEAHPDFPLLIVTHAAKGGLGSRDAARAESVKKALSDGGAPRVEISSASDATPIALPGRADSAARNERLEIVFVAPSQ